MKPYAFERKSGSKVQTRMSDIQEQRRSIMKHITEREATYVRLLNPAGPETVYANGKMCALTNNALVVHSGPFNHVFRMMSEMYERWQIESDRSPLCYILHKASYFRLAREFDRMRMENPGFDRHHFVTEEKAKALPDQLRYRNIPVIKHPELQCRGVLFGERYRDGEDEYTTHTKSLVEEHDFTKGGEVVGFGNVQPDLSKIRMSLNTAF